MIELNISYLKYVNESEFWGLRRTPNPDPDDLEQYLSTDRILDADYFIEDVLPKIKHAGIEWMKVNAENTPDCIAQIHQMVMKAAKDLDKDPYVLADNFFETQNHIPKKDMYLLVQLHDAVEKRIDNMPLNQAPVETMKAEEV